METKILGILEEIRDKYGDPQLTIKTGVMTSEGRQVLIEWDYKGDKYATLGVTVEEALHRVALLQEGAMLDDDEAFWHGIQPGQTEVNCLLVNQCKQTCPVILLEKKGWQHIKDGWLCNQCIGPIKGGNRATENPDS